MARVGAGTFGGAGVEFRALALQPGDKAVVTGEGSVGSNPSGIPLVTPFVRFTSSGAPDGSFSGDGIAALPAARANSLSSESRAGAFGLASAKDGRVVADGSFYDSGVNLLALWAVDSAGNPAVFGSGGIAVTRLPGATNAVGNAAAVGLDGNPVVVGDAAAVFSPDQPAGLLARYGGFGSLFTPPPPPPPPPRPNPKSVQLRVSGRLVVSKRGRTSFSVLNKNTGGPIKVSATLVSKSKVRVSKRRKKFVTFAKATATIPAKARRTVTLSLNRGNLALLRRLKRVSVRLTVTVTASGKRNVIRKNARLDAPRRR